MKVLWLLPALALCLPIDVDASHGSRGSHSHSGSSYRSHSSIGGHPRSRSSSGRSYHAPTSGKHRKSSARCTTCQRDQHGRIRRSQDAKHNFMRQTGYPHGRKGYVIDHVVPLACGGADSPSNMQWQTKAEARAKDKWERKGCRR